MPARWSRMRTGCLCTQEDLCASLWTPSAKLTTCLTKSSLHQVCLAREHVFVARFFKRFLLFGAGNTYGVDTGYGNFTGVVGGFELFRIFLFYNTGCFKYSCPTIWVVSNILVLQCELLKMNILKVGMVQRGEVDIGGGMFSLMKERAVNFKCLLTKIFNLKKYFHFLLRFRRWWTSATASVLRKIQSWWKLQGNFIYCVVRTTFFDGKFLGKYFVFFFTEKPQSVPVQAVVGSLLDASLGRHRGRRRRHGLLHVHLHLQGLILFLRFSFLNDRPFLEGGDKDHPRPSFKGDGTSPNCVVYIWSSCKAGWILHLPF